MERRRSISPVLALAVGIGSLIVALPVAMAEEPAQQPAPTVQAQQPVAAVQAQQAPDAVPTQQPSAGTAQVQQTPAGLQSQPPVSQAGQTQQCTEAQKAAVRIKVTGSNISRPATDCSLPLLVLDRGYIDQSGAMTPSQLLRSVPQAQGSR